MKKTGLLLLSTLLLASQIGFAGIGTSAELMQNFTSLLNQTMAASDGEVLSLYCAPNLASKGILCATDIRLIDMASDSQGGGEETCREIHTYNGGKSFETVCSTCQYSKIYGTYRNSCTLKFLDKKVKQ